MHSEDAVRGVSWTSWGVADISDGLWGLRFCAGLGGSGPRCFGEIGQICGIGAVRSFTQKCALNARMLDGTLALGSGWDETDLRAVLVEIGEGAARPGSGSLGTKARRTGSRVGIRALSAHAWATLRTTSAPDHGPRVSSPRHLQGRRQ